MKSRRTFLQSGAVASAGLLLAADTTAHLAPPRWRMPDEGEPHARTWMAFGASNQVWGRRLLPVVRRNLALAAQTIARYEPVSMLVREADHSLAKRMVGRAVDLVVAPHDDLWLRDTGPVFVVGGREGKAAIDFNFNGWGKKQQYSRDAGVAKFVAVKAGVKLLRTELVLEGGGIEVDGHGTAIVSESCVLIDNRNPGLSKPVCEARLKSLLGLKKIIWLPGVRGQDITDGHTDFYARFAGPGVVFAGYEPDPAYADHAVTKRHLKILRAARDARGKALKVIPLPSPGRVRPKYDGDDFAAGYIGFYVCNGAVIGQQFGDPRTDAATREKLKAAFPGREVVQLNLDGIAAGGGSIHCATQQEPSDEQPR
jgi:agmatine deiminase